MTHTVVHAALNASHGFGFEAIVSPHTFVSNFAAAQLLRKHSFKLVGVLPRAAYIRGRRGATDAMIFYKDVRPPPSQRPAAAASREPDEEEEVADEGWMAVAEELAVEAATRGEVFVPNRCAAPSYPILITKTDENDPKILSNPT